MPRIRVNQMIEYNTPTGSYCYNPEENRRCFYFGRTSDGSSWCKLFGEELGTARSKDQDGSSSEKSKRCLDSEDKKSISEDRRIKLHGAKHAAT
jgi:hypothetical protein